jgi:MOSC domain-containing protein YiiM
LEPAVTSETLVGRIVSLQVGMPENRVSPQGRDWRTAIHKTPVGEGRVPLGRENLAGDYQANRKYHGGPDKAVCAYSAEHYPEWRELLAPTPMPFGAFGENITVEGIDRGFGLHRRRVPGRHRHVSRSASRASRAPTFPNAGTGRTCRAAWSKRAAPGFYLRVLETGDVGAGDALALRERPHAGWTLTRANVLMYDDAADRAETEALRALALLSAEWKRILGRKLAR